MNRKAVRVPYLDDGVELVQEGAWAYVADPLGVGRPWAVLACEYAGEVPPEGWFFLDLRPWNRKTITACVREGHLEVNDVPVILRDGYQARIARVTV